MKYSVFSFTSIAALLMILLSGCSSTPSKNAPVSNTTSSTELSKIDFRDNYQLVSSEYGTETTVAIKGEYRVMDTNALPNHRTGKFPNNGNPNTISPQKISYKIPIHPNFSGVPRWAREPGVAVNGVKFEPETAERFVCETGEVYRIEAMQDLVNLGLDFNHAHVQPTGAYHYHGVPTELVRLLDNGQDTILVGFAHDGFPIYYSKSGRYKPSYRLADELRTGDVCNYRNPKQNISKELNNSRPDGTFVSDWEYVEGLGDLDECNGIEIDGRYAYFVTDEYPFMSRCLKGEFTETRPQGPPPGPGRPPHRHGDGPPHGHGD
ncbi:MAG: YHYH protein [Saprospiraceae bacterium]|nr:YHYH protein [Lewinella sp.]